MNDSDFLQSIAEKYKDKLASFQARDASFVERFYAVDAIVAAPGRDPLIGRDKIKAFYAALLARPTGASYRSFHAVQTSPVTGHDFADFSITPEGSDEIRMKFLFLWSRREAGWFCDGYMYIRGESFAAAENP